MAEKINRSVVTSSFSEDNYARRMLERTMDAVDNNADILSDVEQVVEPFPLWGTYVQASGAYPPQQAGSAYAVQASDFTVEQGMPATIAGAKAIIITVEGVKGATTEFDNKAMIFRLLGANAVTITDLYDTNVTGTTWVFSACTDLHGIFRSTLDVRRKDTHAVGTTQNTYSHFATVGDMDANVHFTPSIQNFRVILQTNALATNGDITYKVYARF